MNYKLIKRWICAVQPVRSFWLDYNNQVDKNDKICTKNSESHSEAE